MTRPESTCRCHSQADPVSNECDIADIFADRFAVVDDDEETHSDDENGETAGLVDRTPSTAHERQALISSDASELVDNDLPSSRTMRNSIRKSRGMFMENPFADQQSIPQNRPTSINNDYRDGFVNSHISASSPSSSSSPALLSRQLTGHNSIHGPAHPYNMYSQNVADDESEVDEDETLRRGNNHNVTMGFPISLRNTTYSQADTEQLPPYSEYPEDGAPKHIVVPTVTSIPSPLSNIRPIAEEPQSMSDSPATDNTSLIHEEASVSGAEKEWNEKTWKEKRRTRVCGIPFIWLVSVGSVGAFIIIVLAAATGGYFGAQSKEVKKAYAAVSDYLDAKPTTSMPSPIATGSFQLQISSPQEVQSECVTDSNLAASWDCGLSAPDDLAISIDTTPNGGVQSALVYSTENHTFVGYGSYLPYFDTPTALIPVTDLDTPHDGVALHFQLDYNKVVVVPGDLFDAVKKGNQKRLWSPMAKAGDRPWFCSWNNTLLEGFIYVAQPATSWYNTTGVHELTPPGIPTSSASATSKGPACTYTANSDATDVHNDCPPALNDNAWSKLELFPYVIKLEERRHPGDTSTVTCQKMQILNDGSYNPVVDDDGNFITMTVAETNPSLQAYNNIYNNTQSKNNNRRRRQSPTNNEWIRPFNEKAVVSGSCHCQWFSGKSF